jgi:hypothetical protein
MLIERAFELIHNFDIPESKRIFFQQWATIVVNENAEIVDVIKHFKAPNLELNKKHLNLYPKCVQFTAKANEMFKSMEELRNKTEECKEAFKNY